MKSQLLEQPSGRISACAPEVGLPGKVQPNKKPKRRRWFPHLHKRRLLLIVGDLLLVNMMLFIAQVGRTTIEPSFGSIWRHSYWFATLSSLWLIFGRVLGIYRFPQADKLSYSLKSTLLAAVVVCLVSLLIPVITPSLPHRRLEAVEFLALMVGATGLWRLIFVRCFSRPVLDRRALVIGAGWAGRTLVETFSEFGMEHGSYIRPRYDLLGFIDDDATKERKIIAGLPVLGGHASLVSLVKRLQPDELVLAVTQRNEINPGMFQAILQCRELGVSIIRMQSLYENLTHQVPLEHTGNNLDVVMPLFPSFGHRLYCVIREAADILIAILGSLFLVLTIPVIWAANRFFSPGPLFYSQDRVGKSGEVFKLLKFRSMVVDAEAKTGEVWARQNDDRITPMGRFLRKSRLDELPQFWNVLKGEMSLIGPRPERPCFVGLLEKEILFYRLRHAIKPGLTGWAQVKYRYGASVADAFVKLSYDFYYIKNQSLLLDLVILLRTVGIVLGFKGQ